ncbi:hypothetical protein ACHAP5_012019 [Fusarium lateritium]
MANNAAPKSLAPQSLWLNKSPLTTTTEKLTELTNRLSILRAGSSDAAEDAGFGHDAADVINARAVECDSLVHESKELVMQFRETDRTAKILSEAAKAVLDFDEATSQSNIAEHATIADNLLSWAIKNKPAFVTLLQSLGDELPPNMSQTLKSMNFDVPDSQPLHLANKKIKELSGIRDENTRIWGQIQELQTELQRNRDLLTGATNLAQSRDDTITSLTEDKESLERTTQKLQDNLKTKENFCQEQGKELIKLTNVSRDGEERLTAMEQDLDRSKTIVHQLEARMETSTRSENRLQLAIRSLESTNQAQSWQLHDKRQDCMKAKQDQNALRAEVTQLQEYLTKVTNHSVDIQQQLIQARSKYVADKESYETAAKDRNAIVKDMNDKRLSLDQDVKGLRDELSSTQWQRDQFGARLASSERALATDRNALESTNEELRLANASSKKHEAAYQALADEMRLFKANTERFLVGSDSVGFDLVSLHMQNMLADDGKAMVVRTQPIITDWELLPIWNSESQCSDKTMEVDCVMLELLTLRRSQQWDQLSGVYNKLCSLKACLLSPNAATLPQWLGQFMFAMLSFAVSRESPHLMIRLAAWQIMWLLHRRWTGLSDDAFLQTSTDAIGKSLCSGKPDFTPEGLLNESGPIQVFCAYDKAGVVAVDLVNSTIQWVPMQYVELQLDTILLRSIHGEAYSKQIELGQEDLVWAYNNLD